MVTLSRAPRPRRRATDHSHQEYWETDQQHRYEDRIAAEIKGIREELRSQGVRITLMIGGIGVLIFAIPVIAPFVRSALNLP